MPTLPTPDEEFDAQFRLGLEHYPEQPEDPAAWHRLDLLLDADLRQRALRRRVLRLLGAEAGLLLVGVWAMLAFLQVRLPPAPGQLPLAKIAPTKEPANSLTRTLATTDPRGQATQNTSAPTPLALLDKQPAMAPPTTARHAPEPGRAGVATPPVAQRAAALTDNTRSRRRHQAASIGKAAALNSLARAGVRPAPRHPLHKTTADATATHDRQENGSKLSRSATESSAATRHLAEAGKLAFRREHRLHRSIGVAKRELLAAAGRQKTRHELAVASPQKAFPKAPNALPWSRQHAVPTLTASRATTAANMTSAALPIGLLAPRWPVSSLHFQLPDSLALLALLPLAHPADSLNPPPPRPPLSTYRLRLGLVGAPELSTVRADRLSRPGSSLGVQLEYQLGRRWRLSAGYLYTNKLYVARGTDYTLPAGYTMPHGYVIDQVTAACRIVDIPLNLRYDLWQRPRYQVFASVGLSSLLMRREQYTYDYELVYGKPVAPYSWELANGSQHVLKVLNLSAGYERAVGPRWTVQAEPFLKLPLAGVGFGAVRLSSAGVFFSLKYGLLPVHPAPAPR